MVRKLFSSYKQLTAIVYERVRSAWKYSEMKNYSEQFELGTFQNKWVSFFFFWRLQMKMTLYLFAVVLPRLTLRVPTFSTRVLVKRGSSCTFSSRSAIFCWPVAQWSHLHTRHLDRTLLVIALAPEPSIFDSTWTECGYVRCAQSSWVTAVVSTPTTVGQCELKVCRPSWTVVSRGLAGSFSLGESRALWFPIDRRRS